MQLEGSEQDNTLCFDVGRDFKFSNLECTNFNYYTICKGSPAEYIDLKSFLLCHGEFYTLAVEHVCLLTDSILCVKLTNHFCLW